MLKPGLVGRLELWLLTILRRTLEGWLLALLLVDSKLRIRVKLLRLLLWVNKVGTRLVARRHMLEALRRGLHPLLLDLGWLIKG